MPDYEFVDLVLSSDSYSEALRRMDLVSAGGTASKLLKRRITEIGILTDHFGIKYTVNKHTHELDDVLVKDSSYANTARLKKRLVRDGIMQYICEGCGNEGVWNNQPLTLQLDHINGHNDDHRRENLRFLCPNCHSQTSTYSGKNKGISFI